MKILHTIEGMGAKFGGIATCTYDLIKAIHQGGEDVSLMTLASKDRSDVMLGHREMWSYNLQNDGIGPFNFSQNCLKWLNENKFDVYHVNGMWQHIVHATCAKARKEGSPYVITPHGMLYPQTLRLNYWKKWLMLKLWFHRDLMNATCIHVTCNEEMTHIRQLGYKGSIAVIGNPVNVSESINRIFCERRKELRSDILAARVISIGYLGRIHPRKHIEEIIKGMAIANKANVSLVIMGSGDEKYGNQLKEWTRRLGLSDQVEFAGFVSGEEKFRRLAKLDALFVPSDMENFGMIIPEALLVGTPVMASKGTPWEEFETRMCGWWRDNSPEEIAKVIEDVCQKSPQELFEMGKRGRDLILEKYESSRVAKQMIKLYRWLLGKTTKPDFIYNI